MQGSFPARASWIIRALLTPTRRPASDGLRYSPSDAVLVAIVTTETSRPRNQKAANLWPEQDRNRRHERPRVFSEV